MLFRSTKTESVKEINTPEQLRVLPANRPDLPVLPVNAPANVEQIPTASLINSNTAIAPDTQTPELASSHSWQFEAVAGTPKVGAASTKNSLAVGDYLETDAASRARITVANIGNVEIEPNSRVKLVDTNPEQHRLSLERGVLQAKISAPPRLFIVDTPSAAAVDLGCEYKLEVDKAGNSTLAVTRGFVSLNAAANRSSRPGGLHYKRGKGWERHLRRHRRHFDRR